MVDHGLTPMIILKFMCNTQNNKFKDFKLCSYGIGGVLETSSHFIEGSSTMGRAEGCSGTRMLLPQNV